MAVVITNGCINGLHAVLLKIEHERIEKNRKMVASVIIWLPVNIVSGVGNLRLGPNQSHSLRDSMPFSKWEWGLGKI